MPEITKLLDALPQTVKLFLGAMVGMQVLAILAWLVMMGKEISNKDVKEKES